jgi:hypothetical protein
VRIDDHLPRYEWNEVHAVDVAAAPETVMAALRSVTAAEVRLLRVLMGLRTLPARLAGRRPDARPGGPLLESMRGSGFVPLAEDPGRELVLGVIGRFWQPCPVHAAFDAAGFASFREPGWAKAAMSFHVAPGDRGGTRLVTETRIAATDDAARRRFRAYWLLVRPGSGLIRRSWLSAVKRRAEAL